MSRPGLPESLDIERQINALAPNLVSTGIEKEKCYDARLQHLYVHRKSVAHLSCNRLADNHDEA
jgi:hypothetical protein